MESKFAVLAALALGFCSFAATNERAKVTDLGPTSIFDVTGNNALNDRGELAGYVLDANSHSHAALYSNGRVTVFGTLGGDFANATAINNSGEVVGFSYLAGDTGYHASIFTQHGARDLGTLGGDDSLAYAVNDAGRIVGLSTLTPGDSSAHAAMFFKHQGPIDLGSLGGSFSAGLGINHHDAIVGISLLTSDVTFHAALFSTYAPPLDLGTLGGISSWAYAINDDGLIVGYSTLTDNFTTHAAVFTPGGTPTDLGTLGGPASQAIAVNDDRIIVGFADTAQGQTHAALWRNVAGTWVATDINTLIDPASGWTIDSAYGINNRGVIEAVGRNADNIQHTLLLRFKNTDHDADGHT